jgi:hypothetical protein
MTRWLEAWLGAGSVVASVMLGAAAGAGAEVQAQQRPPCAPLAELAAKLDTIFGETPAGRGLGQDGRLLEIYASAKTGTWTAVVLAPGGLACVLAIGKDWQQIAQPGEAM